MIKTQSEVRKFFEEQNVTLHFIDGTERKFRTVNSLHTFINGELEFTESFKVITRLKPHQYKHYNNVKSLLEQLMSLNNVEEQKSTVGKAIQSIKQKKDVIYSKSHIAEILFEIESHYKGSNQSRDADRILEYFINYEGMKSHVWNSAEQQWLHSPDLQYYINRLSESRLGNGYRVTIENERKKVFKEIDEFKAKIVDETEKIQTLNDEYVQEQVQRFEQLYTDYSKKHKTYYEDTTKKFKDIETLYTEYKRLEGPSKYWENYAKNYGASGMWWMGASIFTGALMITLCAIAFYNFDKIFPTDLSAQNAIRDTVKWVLIFSVGISTIVYILRLFVKLTLSSFHLQRDAQERLNLSHYYLALITESQITEGEKKIIIESLFSRAETGLLKGDSSPAFPTSILDSILKGN